MQKMKFRRILSVMLCVVLIAAVALTTTGCNGNTETPETTTTAQAEVKVLGQGKNKFSFTVVEADGKETEFEINTDKKIVGEALVDLGLIKGDEGPYGLYVKEVNGISADYDKDGVYWAFYIDGEYAPTGVDMTEIETGKAYSFRAEKG